MTVVKTNLYWVLITLITVGPISVNTLVAQCNLTAGDTLSFSLLPGACQLSQIDLLDELKTTYCPDATDVTSSLPFTVNSTVPIQIITGTSTISAFAYLPSNDPVALFCNNYLNISLNANCRVTLNAATLLQGNSYCYLNYTISVVNSSGQIIGNSTQVDISAPGIYSVSVQSPQSGNSCWGTVVVEDKHTLDVQCKPDTVNCIDNNNLRPDNIPGSGPAFPDLGEPATWVLAGSPNTYLVNTSNACGIRHAYYVDVLQDECIDVDVPGKPTLKFKSIYHRQWEFQDQSGNIATCVQKIYVLRTDLKNIVVDDFWTNCLDDFSLLDAENNPLPEETGFPRIAGTNHLSDACGTIKMTYNDTRFPLCGRSVKIVREWILIDWCSNEVQSYNQVILVEDRQPPVFLFDFEDIFVPTDLFLCGVENLELPAPRYTDCGSDHVGLEILYENYDFYGNKSLVSNDTSLVIPSLTMHGYEGEFKVIYVLTDECGNSSRDSLTVNIRDIEAPIAVCDEYTAVSIGGNGYAQVRALTFDDLSVDNCEIASYDVRKLTGKCFVNDEFTDIIQFCCEEVGDTVLVEFRVTDAAGNYNTCMVVVDVQDKFPPQIYCPGDVIIDCQDDPRDLDLTGQAWAVDNCDKVTIDYDDDIELNECGEGLITRIWIAEDLGGFEKTCTQLITVRETNPFGMTPNRWPADVFLNGCGHDLSPEATGEPRIGTGACSNVAFTHKDAYFNKVEGACFKIVREWTVIDWCRYGNYGPDEGIWRHSQIIEQVDQIAPEFFNFPQDTVICLFGDDCVEEITISADAFDDCTAPFDLQWYTELYEADYMDRPLRTGTDPEITEFLEPGDYVVVFRVSDGCGNIGTHELYVTIRDCEPPVAECPPFASSVVLGTNGQVALWISDFNLKGSDNCTPKDKLSYSFSPDSIVSSVIFTCADIPDGIASERFIRFYAIDDSGNAGFCEMGLEIKDNSLNLCEDQDSLVVSGLILTEELGNVDNVQVALKVGSAAAGQVVTGLSGTFAFRDLEEGQDYTLSLEKGGRIDDGLTTFDLILIARHVVGLKPLDSPYKVIAADIDNNQNITARDLVWLRQVILGSAAAFPNGQKNWRFVDERYEFSNPQRPWPFPESIAINRLNQSEIAKNFVAVKIGDVNGTNEASKRVTSGARSAQRINLLIDDVDLAPNQASRVPVRLSESGDLAGLQLTFEVDTDGDLMIESIEPGALDISSANYRFEKETGLMHLSWNRWEEAIAVDNDDTVFYLVLKTNQATSLSGKIDMSTSGLTPEIVNGDLEVGHLGLELIKSQSPIYQPYLHIQNNRPNPFFSSTSIPFEIGIEAVVKFEFFDLSGRLLYRREDTFGPGQNELTVTSDNLQNHAGVILYKISTPWMSATKKMTLLH